MIGVEVAPVVTATSSTVAAAALLYVAKQAREFVGTVEANEERSETNRELLVGDDHRDGVLDYIDDLEPEP